ncbi:MAG TPA: penicillin-binding transpeptidase domain-containing protein, partial [Vicinamibacteria bacterium]|nr:penicillin-binding transpeptidase domain-containing protein [Vicinamibacteria bacterium]
APYFLEDVRKYLEKEYGSQRIYQGGLRVYTTLDPATQRAANRAMARGLMGLDRRSRGFQPVAASVLKDGRFPARLHLAEWDRPFDVGDVVRGVVLQSDRQIAVVQIGDRWARVGPAEIAWTRKGGVSDVLPIGAVAPFVIESLFEEDGRKMAKVLLGQEPEVQGALIAMDVKSGAVRAMVGGWDFEKSKFNRATQAMRQVGSAFKPIVYAAAIETLGYTPATLIDDAPIAFPDAQGMWSPHNFDYAFWGPITVRRAVEQSRNIPAIKTLHAVGIPRGIEYARRLGLSGPLPPYLPIAIGAGEATPAEMVSAFGAFGHQGLRMKPYLITRITDRDGNVIEENRPVAKDAVRADTAYLVTTLLRGVVQRGTAARAASLQRPIAGKTGTTNDFTDAWFVGYEPGLAAAVWVGYDDKRKSLGRREEGSRAALPIWMDFWRDATKGMPVQEFEVPSNIVFVPVDTGGAPGAPGAAGVRMEAFVAGTEPRHQPALGDDGGG